MRAAILFLSAVCIFDPEFAYCSAPSTKQSDSKINVEPEEDLQAEVEVDPEMKTTMKEMSNLYTGAVMTKEITILTLPKNLILPDLVMFNNLPVLEVVRLCASLKT